MKFIKKIYPAALFISIFSGLFFPTLLYAQSTTPWSFYNNPTQSNAMDIFYNGSGGVNPALRILKGGSLGINVTPSKPLQVHSATADNQVYLSSNAPSLRFGNNAALGSSSLNAIIGMGTSASQYLGGAGDLNLYALANPSNVIFGTVNAERMRVNSAGNVGIGQTAPQGRLDISSNGGSDGVVITQQAENSMSIQGYIDGNWALRASYAGGCCNALYLQPDAGGVGIGIPATTISPYYPITAKLDILAGGDDVVPAIRLRQNNAPNYGIDMGIDNNVDGGLYFRNVNNGASAVAMVIRRDNGYVGIGGISPSYHLHVNGNGFISGDLSVNTLVTYSLPAANSPQPLCRDGLNGRTGACPSDERLKENIHPLSVNALDMIMKLKPTTFNFKQGGTKQSGFIAQDVLNVIPEAVGKSSDDFYTLNDMAFTAYLVKAAQELNEKNNQLESQISSQQQQINELKDLVRKLDSQINEQ